MKKKSFLTVFFIFLISSLFGEIITLVIDDYPPFEYIEFGHIKGLGPELTFAALEEVGLAVETRVYPFARAYQTLIRADEAIFYCSLARQPEREDLVYWVGYLSDVGHALIAKRESNISINGPEDLKKYRLGTVFEDLNDQFLRRMEDEWGLTLDRVVNYEMNIRKLMLNRIDIWAGSTTAACQLLKRMGYNRRDIEEVYTFEHLQDSYYLVASKTVPLETVEKVREGFDIINKNGRYREILNEWKRAHKNQGSFCPCLYESE